MRRGVVGLKHIVAAMIMAALFILVSTGDGGAQGSSTLTVTVEAEGAAAGEIFPVRVISFDGSDAVALDVAPGTPATIDVTPGELGILEIPPAGWAVSALACTGPEPFVPVDVIATPGEPMSAVLLTVPENVNVACLLTNVPVPTGTVRLTESVLGMDPGPTVEHSMIVETISSLALPSGATLEVEINAGPAVIAEAPADGFGVFGIDCGEATVLDRFGSALRVEVPADGLVECSVINVYQPTAILEIEKLTNIDAADVVFPFRTGDFEFGIRPSLFGPGFGGVEFALVAGTYEFVELPTDGWMLRSLSCTGFGVELLEDGAPGFRIGPEVAGPVSCTFLNEAMAVTNGDANCDGQVDIIDALVIAQFEAGVRVEAQQCPLGDPSTELFGGAADVDGSGSIDILDALVVARCSAGLPAVLCSDA